MLGNFLKTNNSKIQNKKAPSGVETIYVLYLLLVILGTFALLINLFPLADVAWKDWFTGVINIFVALFIFIGLHKIKSWVVELILIYSAFSLIRLFFDFMTLKPEESMGIFGKLFVIFLISFYFYQIIVFSRTETKKYFKNSGSNLIV